MTAIVNDHRLYDGDLIDNLRGLVTFVEQLLGKVFRAGSARYYMC